MAVLDYATELSPFNGYLKLRLLYACQKLNYFDKLCDTFISLDIKSVQFETIGWILTNPLNNFNLYSQSEDRITRMVRSYQENQRETSEVFFYINSVLSKGIKGWNDPSSLWVFQLSEKVEKKFQSHECFLHSLP